MVDVSSNNDDGVLISSGGSVDWFGFVLCKVSCAFWCSVCWRWNWNWSRILGTEGCLFVCLFVCLCVCLFVCLFVCLLLLRHGVCLCLCLRLGCAVST